MPEPHRAAIALGSNLASGFGDRGANLQEAILRVRTLGQVTACSRFFDTEPVGYAAQPRFLNGAAVLKTMLSPFELMTGLLSIERAMGRVREGIPAKGPRVIDLDLLLFDAVALATPGLTVPHPEMHRRRFVLEPLAEIAPDWMHPGLGLTVAEMLAGLAS